MKIKNVIFENKQYFETIGKIHKSDQLSVMDTYRITDGTVPVPPPSNIVRS